MQLLYFVLACVVFGLANVIPGVSGGTMAVVFGIYERLLSVLSDPLHNIKKEWKFLVTFAIGLAIGILAFGKLMNWALVNYPAQSAMFFIGVILGSIPMLFKSSFLPGGKGTKLVITKVEGSRIVVDEKMQTTVPGLYAAGDCTGGLLQVAKAVYEGAQAGTEAAKALRKG